MFGVKTSRMSKWAHIEHLDKEIMDASKKDGKQSSAPVGFRNWQMIPILCAS
jgi:hypothetical protein